MKSSLRKLRQSLFLLLALGASFVQAQPAPYAAAIAEARGIVRELQERYKVPGMAAAVAIDGKEIWAEGFGWADLENHVPATPLTEFRIGSVSKPMTGVAIGQLVAAGKLNIDAPIQRYVPSFPKKPYTITTRLVAGHLAGIRGYRGREFFSARHFDDVTSSLSIFSGDSLLFVPGTRYYYSTYGYTLLSAVIEGASGEPYLAYMKRHIFQPLGMTATVPEFNDSLIAHRARFYMVDSLGRYTNSPYVDNSNKWAGGGFLSNVHDLLRFGSALLHPGFLGDSTLRLLFTPQKMSTGKTTDYGIGWRITHDSLGNEIVAHSGAAAGSRAILLLDRTNGIVVALLGNLSGLFTERDALPIAALFRRPSATTR